MRSNRRSMSSKVSVRINDSPKVERRCEGIKPY